MDLGSLEESLSNFGIFKGESNDFEMAHVTGTCIIEQNKWIKVIIQTSLKMKKIIKLKYIHSRVETLSDQCCTLLP